MLLTSAHICDVNKYLYFRLMRVEQDGYVLENADYILSGNHGKRMSQVNYISATDYFYHCKVENLPRLYVSFYDVLTMECSCAAF